MKCPYCNYEMRDGYIPTDAIEWVPQYAEPRLRYKKDQSNGFRIGMHAFGSMKKQPAYYCEACNWILIPCSVDETEKF